MCTLITYQDANQKFYTGRTLELSTELPYLVAYVPAGHEVTSQVEGDNPLTFKTSHAILGIVVPNGSLADLKIVEGMNEKGMTFSVLAYPGASGPEESVEKTKAVLSAIDLGFWALGQFEAVEQVKEALKGQHVQLAPLAALGGAKTPFHFGMNDRSGASLVIEFTDGEMHIHDNPVGVLTNGPKFEWHLTNLNNYSFLSNVDRPEGAFGKLKVRQPDSGSATAGLPSSSTAVGRFVRAAYYAQYAERLAKPDAAIKTVAHVMNQFDRPKGASVVVRSGHSEGLDFSAVTGGAASTTTTTEYTSWTTLADLDRTLLFIRTYDSLNYVSFDMKTLASETALCALPLEKIGELSQNTGTTLLAEAVAHAAV